MRVAIIGTGNIGPDLLLKVERSDPTRRFVFRKQRVPVFGCAPAF